MKTRQWISGIALIVATAWIGALPAIGQERTSPIPESKIAALEEKLADIEPSTSSARRKLAIRRVIREGDSLLKTHATAPNRYLVLGILFRSQQDLLSLDNSTANREALLETCRQLAVAPNEYAAVRLDADLLLSQTELARKGADLEARADALRPLIERYRDTEVEPKVLRVTMLMALEFGDTRLVTDIRQAMAERFAGDIELIMFQRDKLAGQVFGALFHGTFERSDGKLARFPNDYLGRTLALYFWSKENGKEDLEQLAAAWKEGADNLSGRIELISFNLDELPDAGEKILRDLGVDWPAMRLPGGRKNPIYQAYARVDPRIVLVSPTGYAAMVMAGNRRGVRTTDYPRWVNSSLARVWTNPRYNAQLQSILAGEFLIQGVEGPFDATFPPELKAIAGGEKLNRTDASVPEEKLLAIQECFVSPPFRYRTPREEIHASYEKADALCREVIVAHPNAPDLWIVRNRRMVALLGLWKLSSDQSDLQGAVTEAKAALAGEFPAGTDIVAKFCLAKESLRAADVDAKTIISDFVDAFGEEQPSGPALAAAAILAQEVGDRRLHEHYRRAVLDNHTEDPMMWTVTSSLVDRFHRYWLYRAPYTAGWSFGRRQSHFLSCGEPDDARRVLRAELKTLDGDALRIPEDTSGKWTVLIFMSRLDQASPRGLVQFAQERPFKDVDIMAAVLDDDVDAVRASLEQKPHDCPMVVVPGGMQNPLVHKLGILAEDQRINIAILRPDGSIATVVSGLTGANYNVTRNVIEWHDEKVVDDALESGDLEEAKRLAFALAPLEEPTTDPRARPKPISIPHRRARAKVYMAMKDWRAALPDAEKVFLQLTARDGGMSLRTAELDMAEELKATILGALDQPKSER